MKLPGSMQIVCQKVGLRDRKLDFSYWQSQPHQSRLGALEQIRSEFHHWQYGAEPRLQRVYTIAQR
jgi:hypothetical protein